MASPLVSIIKEELTKQRTFLSSDEEDALSRPQTYEDEEDLALDRVRRRRLVFYGALRDHFIREGRPVDRWRDLIAEEEAAPGEPTIASQLGRQVLEWSVRTSDRGAMLGSFVAKTLRWVGTILLLFALWSWFQGALTGVVLAVVALSLVLLLAGRIVGNLAAERAATLAEDI
ncbi:MAG: hypothetical protein ACRDJN_08950 [Chloroflexota bacterium]